MGDRARMQTAWQHAGQHNRQQQQTLEYGQYNWTYQHELSMARQGSCTCAHDTLEVLIVCQSAGHEAQQQQAGIGVAQAGGLALGDHTKQQADA